MSSLLVSICKRSIRMQAACSRHRLVSPALQALLLSLESRTKPGHPAISSHSESALRSFLETLTSLLAGSPSTQLTIAPWSLQGSSHFGHFCSESNHFVQDLVHHEHLCAVHVVFKGKTYVSISTVCQLCAIQIASNGSKFEENRCPVIVLRPQHTSIQTDPASCSWRTWTKEPPNHPADQKPQSICSEFSWKNGTFSTLSYISIKASPRLRTRVYIYILYYRLESCIVRLYTYFWNWVLTTRPTTQWPNFQTNASQLRSAVLRVPQQKFGRLAEFGFSANSCVSKARYFLPTFPVKSQRFFSKVKNH